MKLTGKFRDACFLFNTVEELRTTLLQGPDQLHNQLDMQIWELTPQEWRQEVKAAIEELSKEEKITALLKIGEKT